MIFGLYMWFDMREGGREADLTTTKLGTFSGYTEYFGLPYLTGMIVLNVLLAVTAAVLMVQSFRLLKARRAAARSGVCTVGGGLLLGFSAFACPGCPLPLLATLGTTFFAASLPLYGLEFKIVTLIITGIVLFRLLRPGAFAR
ncbi:hypothetical protein [Rhizocola hellebori]|uniref:hypothetical protein n=1 Tax=Rhizocola hellebori TaxID=1392758 RepID=UPI00194366C3|nr:hypothetical protein [Rhizocola hellebori]